MGSGYQRRPPQDCPKIPIQSRPQRGVNPPNFANTFHGRRSARPKKIKGAGIIGRHGQSGDDQDTTTGAATAGAPVISIGEQQGQCTRRHNLRRSPTPQRGRRKQKQKERRHIRHSPSLYMSQSPPPPPPRRKITTSRRARRSHISTSREQDENKDKKKNPTGCKYCTKYRGNGLAHGRTNNIPHSKCNYNKKWTGWRPEWVCKKIGFDFNEYNECSE